MHQSISTFSYENIHDWYSLLEKMLVNGRRVDELGRSKQIKLDNGKFNNNSMKSKEKKTDFGNTPQEPVSKLSWCKSDQLKSYL